MSALQSGNLKEQILKLFAKHPHQLFKPNEIARRLSIKHKSDYNGLLRILNELFQSKQINRERRKRYGRAKAQETHRVVGTLSTLKSGDGFVELASPQEGRVLVKQRFIGTAMNGDTVAVNLFAPSAVVQSENKDILLEGEITEVLERSQRPIVGVLEKSKNFFFVVPDDRRFGRDIYITKEKKSHAHPGDKVVVVVDEWNSPQLNPEGHIVEVLGKSGEVSAEMAGVAREF